MRNTARVFAIAAFVLLLLAGCTTPDSYGTDATLSALGLEGVVISPSFSADVTAYTAGVLYEVSSVTVSAAATDAAATMSGTGSRTLSVGENALDVVVTAEDGVTATTYTIIVTRNYSVSVTAN